VGLIEGWIAVRGFNSEEDTWIPRFMVQRAAPPGTTLASTFVSVIEPYETQPVAASIKRLALQSADGKTLSDSHVALLIQLADGRRDVAIVRDPEDKTAAGMLHQPDFGIRSDAELILVRLQTDGKMEFGAVCGGSQMTCAKQKIAVPTGADFVEWPDSGRSR
jgi:hypothetical protein